MNVQNKVIVITGGAGGIGSAQAKLLARNGAEVWILDLVQEKIDQMVEELKRQGGKAHGAVADVTSEEEWKTIVERIVSESGRLDVVVNNAGIIKRIPMHEMKRAEFQQVIDIDLVGPFIVSSAVIPEMMERKEGKIINICSMMSELGRETVSAYAAAKGAILGLTREWAAALVHDSVRVNAIVVAEAWTPLYANWIKTFGDEEAQQKRLSLITDRIPLEHRMTSTEEIADTTCFLLSDRSSHTTGQWCNVDGGYVNLDRALD